MQDSKGKNSKFILRALLQALVSDVVVTQGNVGPNMLSIIQARCPGVALSINSVGQAIRRIERQGYIERIAAGHAITLRLTAPGRIKLLQLTTRAVRATESPQSWDGLWRLVLFSIPEDKKQVRQIFRQKLQEIGFIRLQRSAWLYPHVCEGELLSLAEQLGIKEKVSILLVASLPSANSYLQHFNLSLADKAAETVDSTAIQSLADDDDLIPLTELD